MQYYVYNTTFAQGGNACSSSSGIAALRESSPAQAARRQMALDLEAEREKRLLHNASVAENALEEKEAADLPPDHPEIIVCLYRLAATYIDLKR